MLSQLYIENIAVIEKTEIGLDSGMNILTGETGAGKSIVLDSIHAVLGERVSRELVRTGARSAFVSAVFSNPGVGAGKALESLGYDPEDGDYLIQREIRADGKSVCRINGRPATVSVLKEVGKHLISIHGQHDSYDLLSPDVHIRYIDRLGGLEPLLARYGKAYEAMCSVKEELSAHRMDEAEKARRMDLLSYQIEELEAAQLREGEQEELEQRRALFANSEKIAAGLQSAAAALDGEEGFPGALEAVATAVTSLEEAAHALPVLDELVRRMENARYELEDCRGELTGYAAQLEYDPAELEQVEERLDLLYRLGLKYGETVADMLAFLEKCREELASISLSEERLARLNDEYEALRAKTETLAEELSKKRAAAAKQFSRQVKEELRFLAMPHVDFQAQQERVALNPGGGDRIQFLISTNPGEPLKPIAKIASGGELSRIMLAIKTVLAGRDEVDTLIFDEVDTGVSGGAAQKVGQKLKQVSQNRQVICVTHLAQIAALASTHLFIEKQVRASRTFTQVRPLDEEGRKKELARLIGGDQITDLMLKNAEEMLRLGRNGT